MKLLHIAASMALGVLCPCIWAQTAVILGADSEVAGPAPLLLAPGQVVTFWVTGLKSTPVNGATATSTPFPTMLAGISATMAQKTSEPKLPPVPIISVTPTQAACVVAQPCSEVIGVTVQIPYELQPNALPSCGGCTDFAQIFISDGTNRTTSLGISPVPARVHVLGITHADGSLVTRSNPALVGEVIVMYASGLGWPLAASSVLALKTGDVTPSPAATVAGALSYDYRVNTSPSKAQIAAPDPYIQFIGMSPGSVGLYNVNFVVPPPPAALTECDQILVSSNLTVTLLGGFSSFDGAAICVKKQPQ
jgi:uncharacterized protein (TIGR03437 family)